eukprot:403347504
MELINEGLVLFTAEILTLFTDFEPNPEHRYMVGWVVLSAIIFVSLLNMSFFIYSAILLIKMASITVANTFKRLVSKIRTMRSSFSNDQSMTPIKTMDSQMQFNDTHSNFLSQSTQESSIRSKQNKNGFQIRTENIKQTGLTTIIENLKTDRIDPQCSSYGDPGLLRKSTNYKSKISTIRNISIKDFNQKQNYDINNLDEFNITDDEEKRTKDDIAPTTAKIIGKLKQKF